MITDGVLYLIYGLVYLITSPLRLLPDATLPDDALTGISKLGEYLSNASMVVPISTLAAILAAVVAVEAAVFTYKLIMWTIKRLPTQS